MTLKNKNMFKEWFSNPLLTFLLSCFFYASFVVFAKLLGDSFTPYELSFYRVLIIFLISLIAVFSIKGKIPSFLKINRWIVFKAFLSLASMVTWFMTINNLPVSETIAVSFSTPLLSSFLAVLMLNEKFTTSHLISYICGLIGMYIIVSPEFGKMDYYALIGVFSCFLLSLSFTIIKFLLSRGYEPIEINYFGSMLMVPMSFLLVYDEFSIQKEVGDVMLVVVFGLCIFCAEFLHNTSYKQGKVVSLMPLMFLQIIIASAYDYLVFGTIISTRVLIGAVIVIAGIVYGNVRQKRIISKASSSKN